MCSKLFRQIIILVVLSVSSFYSFSNVTKEEPIENIEVVGERPPAFYLKIFRQQRDEFFSLYNNLVDSQEMQIKCRRPDPPQEHRERQLCEPLFVATIKHRETQRQLTFGQIGRNGIIRVNSAAEKEIKEKRQTLMKQMTQLINENAELKRKYRSFQKALTVYEDSQRKSD